MSVVACNELSEDTHRQKHGGRNKTLRWSSQVSDSFPPHATFLFSSVSMVSTTITSHLSASSVALFKFCLILLTVLIIMETGIYHLTKGDQTQIIIYYTLNTPPTHTHTSIFLIRMLRVGVMFSTASYVCNSCGTLVTIFCLLFTKIKKNK